MLMALRSLCSTAVSQGWWGRVKSSGPGAWCSRLVSDYMVACQEVAGGARKRPLGTLTGLGLLGGAWACACANPDEASLRGALVHSSNRLGLLPPRTLSATSRNHVQGLCQLRDQGRLRHLDLGVASLAWHADHSPDVCLYEASCDELQQPWAARWRELAGRVLDVGFAGRWWVLDAKMRDCDVDEEEFRSLPAHLQATLPPTVREVQRNERLHEEAWMPLKMEEEEVGLEYRIAQFLQRPYSLLELLTKRVPSSQT